MRRLLSHRLLLRSLAIVVAVCAIDSAACLASILQPAAGYKSDDAILVSVRGAAGASQSAGTPNSQQPTAQRLEQWAMQAIPLSGSQTGAGSTSSISTAPSSASVLLTPKALVGRDVGPISWIAQEQSINLPMPAGNDLLRPPQCL
ncbi:MAG: hypothetical protein IT424_09530 [Pirellulales bacterium]|nr:hypothetical protein [Pirellulales bacterium]